MENTTRKNNVEMVSSAVSEAKKSTLRREHIPMGYVPGLPMLSVRGGELCLTIPWLRYRVTDRVDATLVFPVRYVTVCTLPERVLVEFRDLKYDPHFAGLEFGRACGTFRHEGIKDLDRDAYASFRRDTLSLLDGLAGSLIYDARWTASDDSRLRANLSRLLEPSLRGIYRRLDPDFYNKYLTADGTDKK